MEKIVRPINKEYSALLRRAQKALLGKWVRRTVMGGEETGTIINVRLNAKHYEGVEADVEWKESGEVQTDVDPRDLREW